MKIIVISDTHNRHKRLTSMNRLPAGDLLIHAGDLTGQGLHNEVVDVFKWFRKIAPLYTHGIVFIAGNHDRSFDPKFNSSIPPEKPDWLLEELHKLKESHSNITYLENESITIEGIKIWGSPTTPWFHGDRWAFNKYRGDEIAEVWKAIPHDTDIVVTHGPVAYRKDYVPRNNEYTGCDDLRKVIEDIKPKVHIAGHIHEGYGIDFNVDTIFINAAICTLAYEPTNEPMVFDIDTKTKEVKFLSVTIPANENVGTMNGKVTDVTYSKPEFITYTYTQTK